MQKFQTWVRFATQQMPAGAKAPEQVPAKEEEDFIYGRVAVHSDDEEPEPVVSRQCYTATEAATGGGVALQQDHPQMQRMRPLHHQHSHSDTNLQELRHQAAHLQDTPELIRLDSDDEEQRGWAEDWAVFNNHSASTSTAPTAAQATPSPAEADDSCTPQTRVQNAGGSSSGSTAPAASAAPAAAESSGVGSSSSAAGDVKFEAPTTTSCFDTGEEVPDHDHSHERRELIIYAIPLHRGKVIFLPVCPWRTDPEAGPGWKKTVTGHVNKVQGEASDVWQKMANAEQGSAVHRLYKFGKRLLESIPAEERLMRGVPKDVSKVIIRHPTQVSPDAIMDQMQTMTKNYGIKAVGRAAAATVMLPLAIGVDLIILPGPQVLTYYTMWQMYRNTDGAVGTTRMTKFIRQGGSSTDIRVNYVAEPRLDKYYDAANDCPDGVLSEDDIDGLVSDLREPDLLDALLSLRSKALREGGARTSRGGDEYTALPPVDPAASPTGFGAGDSKNGAGAWR